MIDLHTHILPGIDDGAKTVEESISLLQAELESGVKTIALTPHFNVSASEQQEYINKYSKAFNLLREAVSDHKLQIRLIQGAEVAFTAITPEHDLDSLCYEGTKKILIELPMGHYPPYSREILYRMQLDGYTPIIAHAERYSYFVKEPSLLEKLISTGVQIQVNAGGLIKRGKTRRRILKMISKGQVHILATDTHSIDQRPPMLDIAYEIISKKLGSETAQRLVNFNL